MNIKSHYDKYWMRKAQGRFEDYERNLVLPQLFNKGEKVLDLACGQGLVSAYLKAEGIDVTAVDISEEAVRAASKRGVKAILADAENGLPFSSKKFDCVFWGDNVEHLFGPSKVLGEINRVLKNDGRVILSFPNMAYIRYRLSYLFQGKIADTEWSGNPPWFWNHIRFFNLHIMKDFLKENGFKVNKVLGVNRRFPERYLLGLNPSIFSMILVVEARKI